MMPHTVLVPVLLAFAVTCAAAPSDRPVREFQARKPALPEPIPDPPPADTLPYFDDDFARGNECAKAPLTGTGFGWGATQDGSGPPPDSARVVANAESPSGCALALIYSPDLPGGDGWIEPRFKIGTVNGRHLQEIFVGMVIRVPTNYVHRNDIGPDNNKLLRLFSAIKGAWCITG